MEQRVYFEERCGLFSQYGGIKVNNTAKELKNRKINAKGAHQIVYIHTIKQFISLIIKKTTILALPSILTVFYPPSSPSYNF